jgi:uncharacterized protein
MLWAVAIILVIVGVAGTVLPAMPGAVLVFAGIFIAAWVDDFTRIGVWTLVLLGVITIASYAVDWISSAIGVKRSGASGRAVVGASLGALFGLFLGLPGLIIGPFAGAVLAELSVRRDLRGAGRAGLGAWLGFLVGTVAKLGLVFAMIGIALAALFLV